MISVHFNLFLSHFLSAKVSPEWRIKVGYLEKVSLFSEQRCTLNVANRNKDYVNIFPGPDFVSPGWIEASFE